MSGIDQILQKDFIDREEFRALLSSDAVEYLEPMAQKANSITLKNFGRTISIYAPLYISNFCDNECLYCGFKRSNVIPRKQLSEIEIRKEAEEITKTGIRHILVLTGESRTVTPIDYIKNGIKIIREYFDAISIEIYPLNVDEYVELIKEGVSGLTLYQETYDEDLYKKLHGKGPKSDYLYRLNAPERASQAGIRFVNVGALLGLGDWRKDIFSLGLHADYLQNKYPDVEIGVSVPRIQPETGGYSSEYKISDKEFVQAITALRIFLPRAGITISTRESSELRNNLIGLGVTRMSAGSHTEVGGYSLNEKTCGQFDISDTRNVDEIRELIYSKNYQPVFKDWQEI